MPSPTPRRRGGPITRLGAIRVHDPATWEAELRAAIEAEAGCVAGVARRLGVSVRTVWYWLESHPSLRALCTDCVALTRVSR